MSDREYESDTHPWLTQEVVTEVEEAEAVATAVEVTEEAL